MSKLKPAGSALQATEKCQRQGQLQVTSKDSEALTPGNAGVQGLQEAVNEATPVCLRSPAPSSGTCQPITFQPLGHIVKACMLEHCCPEPMHVFCKLLTFYAIRAFAQNVVFCHFKANLCYMRYPDNNVTTHHQHMFQLPGGGWRMTDYQQ